MTSEDVLLEHFSLSAFELGEFMGREGRYPFRFSEYQ
jgi:hypothetical protein